MRGEITPDEADALALSDALKDEAERLRKRVRAAQVKRYRRASTRRRILDLRYGRSPS